MNTHDHELAEAYVPYQEDTSMFHSKEGLEKGTIFKVLYKPLSSKERYPREGCGCFMIERECIPCNEKSY